MVAIEPTIVNARSTVILAVIRDGSFRKTLNQAIARSRAGGAIDNHLLNLRRRTRILDHAAGIAGARAGVVLHETRVGDTP